jgi:hypothetical protein
MTPAREVSEELLATMGSLGKERMSEDANHSIQKKGVPSTDGTRDDDDNKKGDHGVVVEERTTETPLTPPEAVQQLEQQEKRG